MEEEKVQAFKNACIKYLNTLPIADLRNYARYLGVRAPTAQTKKVLVREIIEMLLGKEKTQLSAKGAPPKNPDVSLKVLSQIDYFVERYLGGESQEVEWKTEYDYGWTGNLTIQEVEMGGKPFTIQQNGATADDRDILSMLTDSQKRDLNAALRFLKSLMRIK